MFDYRTTMNNNKKLVNSRMTVIKQPNMYAGVRTCTQGNGHVNNVIASA